MSKVAARWVDMLREAVDAARGGPTAGTGALDDALLFRAHEDAVTAADMALSLSQTAGASATQQRSAVEAAADATQSLQSRAREAKLSLSRARDALEQIRIVALNAGLEGARLGDPVGKPLVLVAEEVRTQVGRTLGSLEDHGETLDQMDREHEKLRDQVGDIQQRSADLARDLLQAQASQRDVSAALGEMADRLRVVTRTDPETAKMVAQAADHARELIGSLSSLASKPHRTALLGALAPALRPLSRVLRDLYRSDLDDDTP